MGTELRMVLFAPDEKVAGEASWAVFETVDQLEQVISDYREESELEKVEPIAAVRPKVISDELYRIIDASLRLARLTDGAFDITVKPVVELWREARRSGRLPDPAALEAARSKVGHDKVLMNPRTRSLRLAVPGMRLDFGGIGKGWAADKALQVLKEHGVTRALIDAGGDLRLGQAPPGESGWRVEIEDQGKTRSTILLSECAVATSGDYYQFVEIGGERYSHIVDPRTGIGVRHAGTVTVVAADGATADALATALSVLPTETGLRLVEEMPRVEARIFRTSHDGKETVIESVGFPS
jgi:thiamine biosynthesis lipoprotein